MMLKPNLFLLALACLLGAGCSEIFSPDISDQPIQLNSPVDSLYSAETNLSFWWEQNSDVEGYELRITQGNAANLALLVDTSLVTNAIEYSFADEGLYQWQVRGVNNGSETAWSERSFILDFTLPEKALAVSFEDDTLTAGNAGSLQWSSLDFPVSGNLYPTTDSIRIYRRNDSTSIGARYFFDETDSRSLDFDSGSPLPFNGPGTYHWQVVSFDRAGNAQVSDFFKITIQ